MGLGKTDLHPMMIVVEKIVRIMTIDDEIKIRRVILEENSSQSATAAYCPDSRKSRNYKSKGASTEPCTRL